MARGSATFKQRDVERAIKAARKAGIEIASVKIKPSGEIEIITTDAPGARGEDDKGGPNPRDTV
jgi:hypothetical protein